MEKKLRIYRAVKSNFLTQPFGVNWAFVKLGEDGNPIRPFIVVGSKNGVCPVGYTPFYKAIGMEGHNGFDFATWYGEPIYHCANFDGWIRTETDWDGGIGIDVVSKKPLLYCPQCKKFHYIKIRCWHNLENTFKGKHISTFRYATNYKDLEVKMGDMVARSNNSGASSGNHLHKGLKWCDENGKGIHRGNGYNGAFDPTPFYENEFVLDVLKEKQRALTTIELARKVVFQTQQFIKSLITK